MEEHIGCSYAYLSDILEIIQGMLHLRPQIAERKRAIEDAQDAVEAKKKLLSGTNKAIYFAICLIPSFILTILICWSFRIDFVFHSILLTSLFLALALSALCDFVFCRSYLRKVVEPLENAAGKQIESVGKELNELKLEMKMLLSRYETFKDKLDKECRHSLAIYLMQQSVKEGIAINLPQAQKHYSDTVASEGAVGLISRIDKSREELQLIRDFVSYMDG